jgi:hypothetical protein
MHRRDTPVRSSIPSNVARVFAMVVCLSAALAGVWGQAAPPSPAPAPKAAAESTPAAAVAIGLGGFHAIRLGMTVDEVKTQLLKETLFLFRGDPDVTQLPQSQQILIEVPGRTFVDRGYFQFQDGKLLIMIVVLSRAAVSYFDVYQELATRYGEPASLDPSAAVWEIKGTRLSLEKPVVLKYVDSLAFDALTASGRVGRDYDLETRQQFLDSL